MPSRAIPSKTLTEGFYRLIDNERYLLDAYDFDGYRGDMIGEGNWVILYVDQSPVGLLWLSMDTEGCDAELVAGSVTDLLALEQLRIRSYAERGYTAAATYAAIAERYRTSAEDTGDLGRARALIYVP